ncbi:hypothetical protein IYX23_15520 [Methylocystis sp. L43]|jgi:hypothetical protein|uniref:hypothetical protein n=1 Tax=unclassified Methylocystis TaxID=2625913 RepID=UPI0018C2FF19|nr:MULTISPECIES: hypothetical protein [unclassified Methylocystis]MBG0799079.1 hypothetical protein [Methylocystis sp. L43]MBG0806545.1 hypothetical protein [Methylocystis sp. H15]
MGYNPMPESAERASRSRFCIAPPFSMKRTFQNCRYAAKKRPKRYDRVGNNFVAHITWLLAF